MLHLIGRTLKHWCFRKNKADTRVVIRFIYGVQ